MKNVKKTATIKNIQARQILDSRGNPTIEVDVYTENGICGTAAVPSGASTGIHEALELRDQDPKKYMGKSVFKAISHVQEKILPLIKGYNVFDQKSLDLALIELDGTKNKGNLGANAILGVSLACARAGAREYNLPLFQYLSQILNCPQDKASSVEDKGKIIPLMNVINGGAHASNNLDFQEFMIVPNLQGNFSENLQAGVEVFHHLKALLKKKNLSTNVGDEGGFAPDLPSHEMAMELLLEAIENAHYKTSQIKISLDCAASEFFDPKTQLYKMQGKEFSTAQMVKIYEDFVKKYPIFSIEDGLSEEDHQGHQLMTKSLKDKILLVGDDLFVTNKEIFEKGIQNNECNSILIKLNQIGTLSETFETMQLAYKNNYRTIISHRSGETADTFIADLAVASNSRYIKTGSLCRSDRVEKYNQLLRIEEVLYTKKTGGK